MSALSGGPKCNLSDTVSQSNSNISLPFLYFRFVLLITLFTVTPTPAASEPNLYQTIHTADRQWHKQTDKFLLAHPKAEAMNT